jgi:hypothetical protein
MESLALADARALGGRFASRPAMEKASPTSPWPGSDPAICEPKIHMRPSTWPLWLHLLLLRPRDAGRRPPQKKRLLALITGETGRTLEFGAGFGQTSGPEQEIAPGRR